MYIYVYLRTLNGFIMSSYSVMLPFTHTVGKSSFHQSISSSKYLLMPHHVLVEAFTSAQMSGLRQTSLTEHLTLSRVELWGCAVSSLTEDSTAHANINMRSNDQTLRIMGQLKAGVIDLLSSSVWLSVNLSYSWWIHGKPVFNQTGH